MYIDKRKIKSGIYYSFSFDDPKTGKRIRLKKDEHPHFTDESEARAWANSQEAYRKSQHELLKKKLAWKDQFFEFQALVEKFSLYQQEHAPNSWENAVFYLEQYALHWFLNIKKSNNVNSWHFLFIDYRAWLQNDARTLKDGKLTYSTCNKAIHSLNSFLQFLSQKGLIDPEAAKKCPAYPDALLNMKGFEDVIPEDEFLNIHKRLSEIDEPSADFWWILYRTGMRFSEAYGVTASFLFAGHTTGTLHEELVQQKIEYYGYLVLESQPKQRFRKREEDGTIERKPLKGRKKIHPKNNRIIPIADKTSWNILARRYKAQKELFEKKTHGQHLINYILFDDTQYSKLKRSLSIAYKKSIFQEKTWHNCRHSYCTFMVGKTRSFFLARAILGHKSNAFERYLHIFEQMSQEARQNEQEINEIG